MTNVTKTVIGLTIAATFCGIAAAAGSSLVQEGDLKILADKGTPGKSSGNRIYDSIPSTYPGSFPSLGYEATSTDEFGEHVSFAGTDRLLDSVVVSLTNWACENDFSWNGTSWDPDRGTTDACATTPGSSFDHPITLNIYEVDNTGPDPAVGSLLGTKTATFSIPFRPSHDSINCPGDDPVTDEPFGGTWYDPVLAACVHGFAFNIEFDFSGDALTLPDEVIYAVAYNTGNHGASSIGTAGPYSSLNVSLDTNPPSIGTDVEPGTLFWDTSHGPFYCDGGAGGTDFLRRDYDAVSCWGAYIPVAEFHVLPGLPSAGVWALVAIAAMLLTAIAVVVSLTRRRLARVV